MVNINSSQSGNQVQLESLDSLRTNTNNSNGLVQPNYSSNNSGLQSLDSIRSNNYSDPNMSIPANDILAPIEALNPEVPESSREDTKERGTAGFIGGIFQGFGRAGLDTVLGVVTLGKVVGGGIIHPKQTLNWVGGGIKYAVNHPIKATKAVAFDLPIGMVKGIIQPYGDAIKKGQYGQAVGRGVFDVGLILLTAGIGDEGSAAGKTGTTVEAVENGTKATEVVENGAQMIKGAGGGTHVVTTGVQGGIKIGKDAIKIGNVTGNVVINIGNTTANVTSTAGRVSKVAATAGGTTEAVIAATETAGTAGKIALGLGDLGGTLGRGATRIGNLLRPLGQGIGSSLNSLVGEGVATVIRDGVATIGKGFAVGGKVIKDGAIIVKAHPIASALIAGKTVDIIDKGLKASDHYNPKN